MNMNVEDAITTLFDMDHHKLIFKVSVECTRTCRYKLKIDYIKHLGTTLTYRVDYSKNVNASEIFSDYTRILEAFLTPSSDESFDDDDCIIPVDIDKILETE